MKKIFCTVIAVGYMLFSLSGGEFVLVKNGKAQCAVVLPDNTPETVRNAVKNFNETLKKVTGAQLRTVHRPLSSNRIVFAFRKADSLLTMDHFSITFPDKRTMRIECVPSAVQWAFNHILRKFANVEWLMQEECGLSYTPVKNLTVPARKICVNNVSWCLSRTYNVKNIHWRQNYQRRLHIDHSMNVHAFPAAKYKKNNSWPREIMPVHNGKKITKLPLSSVTSHWQPCYSSVAASRIAAENILSYLKKHPDTLGLCLGSNDNGGFCECTDCMKMDKYRRNNRSESYFTFINRVLNIVCRKYPKILFSTFAYAHTYEPPSFKLHPNAVVYLTIDINSCVSPEMYKKHKTIISRWGKKAAILGIWDYTWGHPYPAPRLYTKYHMEILKFMYKNNARAYYGECWTHDAFEGPKQYLISKLLWNSDLDMEKVENDWYIRCVGKKAAPYLKAYYQIWNDYFTTRATKTPWFKSATSVYMTFNDISCIYALEEKDYLAADRAMEQVVKLAGTDQEKVRARLMNRIWQYTKIRLRLLGAGIYGADTSIKNKNQALQLLRTVRKSPEYIKAYNNISKILLQDRNMNGCYLYGWYLKHGGSPVNRKFDQVLSNHILAASAFSNHPQVREKMHQISLDPTQLPLIRQLCNTLSASSLQKNLLTYGNGENGIPSHFGLHPNARNNALLETSSRYKEEGKKSFKVTIRGIDAWFLFPIKAKPNRTYLATFKVFAPESSAEGYMERNIYSYRGDMPQQYRLSPSIKLPAGVWKTYSVLTETKHNANTVKLQIRFRNFDRGDQIYIDDIKIMEISSGPQKK